MQGFASGKRMAENAKYLGLGTFKIKSVAPTQEELTKIWGPDAKPLKTHHVTDNGKDMGICNIFLSFETPEGEEKTVKESFFITNDFTISSSGKVEVINEYGENAWVTKEEFDKKRRPAYSPSYLMPYRAAFKGETALVEFIKVFLGIPGTRKYKDGVWLDKTKEELENSKASFSVETIGKFVKGDFSDLRMVLGLQPHNKIQLFLGVNVTPSGSYQKVNLQIPVPGNSSNYERALKKLQEGKNYHNDVIYDYSSTAISVWKENFTSDLSETSETSEGSDDNHGDLLPF